MTVSELIQKTGWKALTTFDERAVSSAYICDLLSWVMAHAQEGTAWVTVQAHLNVVAVASLTGCACVIVPENIAVSDETLSAAGSKGVAILGAPCTAYGAALALHALGLGEV